LHLIGSMVHRPAIRLYEPRSGTLPLTASWYCSPPPLTRLQSSPKCTEDHIVHREQKGDNSLPYLEWENKRRFQNMLIRNLNIKVHKLNALQTKSYIHDSRPNSSICTQNYRVSGICPFSEILNIRKPIVSETGSVHRNDVFSGI
jgi:hypothetical protein